MEHFANLPGYIDIGLRTALTLENMLFCLIGVFLGTVVGMIPGLGAMAAISVLLPITYYLSPETALIMLAGIYYGSAYGGSTASILLNMPGTPANAVTCLDGYPMTLNGRGGVALLMTSVASFVGGSIGIVILMLFAPLIAYFALSFGAPEYFALIVLGLIAASTMSTESAVKGLAMVLLGIGFGTVGQDIYTGSMRFTFGFMGLVEGVGLIALAMGIFGIAEIIPNVTPRNRPPIDQSTLTLRSMKPTRDDLRRSWGAMARGTGIGSFFGTLPGLGASIAAFVAYAIEIRTAREPSRFGKGAIEGIAAPEAANNAADQTAFIPTLTLGIPGSATMALMLGALIIHGITPGPQLMSEQPAIFWGLVMSFWIGNLLLLVLNIPMIGLWVKILLIPYNWLYPAMLMFICLGVYSVKNSVFDVWVVIFFGVLGHFMRMVQLPTAPLLLGFVLGPLLEEHFRRSMLLSRGDPIIFLDRPISAVTLCIAALLCAWALLSTFRRAGRRDSAGAIGE